MTSAREVNALEAVFDESKALGRDSSWQLAMAAVDAGWVSPERLAKTLARVAELEQQCARLGAQAAGVDRLLAEVRTAAPDTSGVVAAAGRMAELKAGPDPSPVDRTAVAASEADAWNDRYLPGTRVRAYPMTRDDAPLTTRTRSRAWPLDCGQAVVLVDDYSGGIALSHVDPLEAGDLS